MSIAIAMLISLQALAQNRNELSTLTAEIWRECSQIVGDHGYKDTVLYLLAILQARADAIPDALRCADAIDQRNELLGIFTKVEIARSCAARGDLTTGRRLAEMANGYERLEILTGIAVGQVAAGDVEGGRETFRSASLTAASIPDYADGIAQEVPLLREANFEVTLGDLDAALTTVEAMKGPLRFSALLPILRDRAKTHGSAEALKLAESIADDGERAVALANIALTVAESGAKCVARELVSQAIKCAELIGDEHRRSGVLQQIGVCQARMGDTNGAALISERLPETLDRWLVVEELAAARVTAGDLDEAIKTARTIKDSYSRHKALLRISLILAKSGETDSALDIADSLTDYPQLRGSALRAVTSHLASSGDIASGRALANQESTRFVKAMALVGIAEGILEQETGDRKGRNR